MSTELEIRIYQKSHLQDLLELKKENIVSGKLDDAIKRAIVPMNQEDIAWVEKVVGVKAMD